MVIREDHAVSSAIRPHIVLRWMNVDVEFIKSKTRRIWEYFSRQGVTVAANLLYGLLCVRILPVGEYAEFAVVFGCAGTLNILMDSNFSGTIIPLIGQHVCDRELIADYVASLRRLAHVVFAAVGVGVVFMFPVFVHHQHWPRQTVLLMTVMLLVTSWTVRISAAYGAVLIVSRRRDAWYRNQMVASVGSLLLLLAFWRMHYLSAFVAITLNIVSIMYVASTNYYCAKHILGTVGRPSLAKQRAILHLALPNIPNAIFYAFQGQIALLLITVFGHTGAVASVGALGRLSQIFVFFGQMNFLLLEPYFSSLSEDKFKKNYFLAVLAQAAMCAAIILGAFAVPDMLLWILGHNYRGLRLEVSLAVLGATLSYFSGVLWGLHTARKYVYWWNSILYIILTLLVQACFICKADLSSVRVALEMNIITAGVALVLNALAGAYGMMRGARVQPDMAEVHGA
jgi:O-antigen/teichoic acid export membrane protein